MKNLKLLSFGLIFSMIFPFFLWATLAPQVVVFLPEDTHFIKNCSIWTNQAIFEDDSVWDTSSLFSSISSWLISEPIVITPNNDSFFYYNYKFKITNLSRNQYVYANVNLTPFLKNPKTYLIQFIDRQKGWITIDHNVEPFNRSTWLVHPQDISKLQNFEFKDAVLIGRNDEAPSFWSPLFNTKTPMQYILINQSINDYVRVTFLNN